MMQETQSQCSVTARRDGFSMYAWGRFMLMYAGSVQFTSVAQLFPTLWDPMDCSTPGFPVHHQLPELAQTHVHWVGDAIQLSHPLLSPSPPVFNLSQHQGLFQWISSSHQVAQLLEFQLPSSEYSGFISFRVDWFDPLAAEGTLKNFLQHHSSKASIFQHSAFFIVQLSHPYMTTGKQYQVSHIAGGFFISWATREVQEYWTG